MMPCRFVCLVLCFAALFAGFARAALPVASGRTINLATDPAGRHKLFIPDGYVHTGQAVDLLIHFHGDPSLVNDSAKHANLNAVIINVTYSGLSSAYQTPFSNAALFGNILSDALSQLRAQPDFADDINWGRRAISSFSAGYAAVREILKPAQGYYDQIDGLLLADSLYASFTSSADHTPLASQMVDFKRFALDARNGSKTMIFSHSQVPTFTYCETRECADALVGHVGAGWQAYDQTGMNGMQFYRRALAGNLHLYGATGTNAASHSLHLQSIAQFLGTLPLAQVPEPGSAAAIALTACLLKRNRRRR